MFILAQGLEEHMLPCIWKQTFGVDCIGCGLQRSAALLLKGEFEAAFFMYPAIYPLLFLFVFLIFDTLKTINHSEKIKLGLAALTLMAAVTNYILKLFIH